MSGIIDIVPPIRISNDSYLQPIETVVEVSEYEDVGIVVTVHDFNYASSEPANFFLQTALENFDERYLRVRELARVAAAVTARKQYYVLMSGPGEINSTASPNNSDDFGVGAFIRVEMENIPGEITFDVKAIVRAHE